MIKQTLQTIQEMLQTEFHSLGAKIQELEQNQVRIETLLTEKQQPQKEYYTPAEVAEATGRKPNSIRDLCREGRIEAEKTENIGRGGKGEWRIPASGLDYLRNKGLLPKKRTGHTASRFSV